MPAEKHARVSSNEEDYYGESSVAVPFNWESQPGTPKRLFMRSDSAIPPLTPSPSYFYVSSSSPKPQSLNPNPQLNSLLGTVFRKNCSRKASAPSSPASLSPSSSSSSPSSGSSPWKLSFSVPSSPMKSRDCSRGLWSDESRGDGENESAAPSPLCFGYGSNHNKSRGCYASIITKLLLRGAN